MASSSSTLLDFRHLGDLCNISIPLQLSHMTGMDETSDSGVLFSHKDEDTTRAARYCHRNSMACNSGHQSITVVAEESNLYATMPGSC